MRINGVARARTSQINLPGIASVANVDHSAISAKSSIYSGAAIGTGCQNGHFPTGARRSRIEEGKKLTGVGNINRNTTRFSALKRDVPPASAATGRWSSYGIGRGSLDARIDTDIIVQ